MLLVLSCTERFFTVSLKKRFSFEHVQISKGQLSFWTQLLVRYIIVSVVFLFKDIHGDHHWKLALKRHRLHVGEAPWTMYKKEFSEFTVSTCMTSKNVPIKLHILIDNCFTSYQESFTYVWELPNSDFAFMNLHP